MEVWRAALTVEHVQSIGCGKCLDVSANLAVKEEADTGFTTERKTRLKGKLPKVSGWLWCILLMAGLLAVLGGIGCQGQVPDATSAQLERELPAEVAAGELQRGQKRSVATLIGRLLKLGVEGGRKTRPDLKIGICGEHGGEPASVKFCVRAGLNYVSCSPFRVPIARLAAAQAAIEDAK